MKVQPITDLKDIKRIKRLLSSNPRNMLLFIMGINAGLRVQNILALRVSDIENAVVGDRITVMENKTKKENVLIINQEIYDAVQRYLTFHKKQVPREFLFKSRKGWNYPLSTYAVTHMVQGWCDEINLAGNYGAHTLRKTWCYQQRKLYGVLTQLQLNRCLQQTRKGNSCFHEFPLNLWSG